MNFLTQLGRWKYAQAVTTCTALSIPISYIAFHVQGHNVWKRFYVAQTSMGRVETFTERMKRMIQEVVAENDKRTAQRSLMTRAYTEVPKVSWFVASTFEPVSLGSLFFKRGALIGLPSYYNYESLQEIPDSAFEVRKVKLFKTKAKRDEQADLLKEVGESEKVFEVERFDRSSPTGKQFADSLILSDKAKKFAIARELYLAESGEIFYKALVTFFALTLGISLGRIAKMKLHQAHVSNRLPMYALSTFIAFMGNNIFRDGIHQYYTNLADEEVAKFGVEYRDGGIEYIEKNIQRNKALRESISHLADSYTPSGDLQENNLRQSHVPLSVRLERIRNLKLDQNEPIKTDI